MDFWILSTGEFIPKSYYFTIKNIWLVVVKLTMISLVNKELKMESIQNNANVYIDIRDVKELVTDTKTKERIKTFGPNILIIMFICFVLSSLYYFRDDIKDSYDNYETQKDTSPIMPYNFFKKI